MTSAPRTYGYKELADRIEAVVGERPSLSSLRAERAAYSRGLGQRGKRPRITAEMPHPMRSDSPTAAARFSVSAIEAWLARHPRLMWDRAVQEAGTRLAAGDDVEAVVAGALRDGISWSVITRLLNEHAEAVGGTPITKAGVHKKFRHLEPGA